MALAIEIGDQVIADSQSTGQRFGTGIAHAHQQGKHGIAR